MALKGDLKDFSLVQLLSLIQLSRKTGRLTIESSGRRAHLYCEEGRLILVEVGEEPVSLSSLLIRSGKLTAEQEQMAHTGLSIRSDKALALRLIDLAFLTQDDIVQVVKAHALEMVYPLFGWRQGSFHFEPGARPPEDQITVAINLDGVVVEGTRRLKESERLQDLIPNLDVTVRFTAQTDSKMRNISLTVDEWKVIPFINPRNTLRKIASYAGLGENELRRIVQRLMTAGLLELVMAEAPPPPPVTAPPVMPRAPAMPANVQRGLVLRLIDRIRRI